MIINSNNNKNIISLVGQYVFDHSDKPISLEELAAYTGFSKFHFNRIFFAATGFQLGEFVQRQKMEKAIYLIKQGNREIIDIALSVGYDSPSSFTRAFKKNFSLTPSDILRGKMPKNDRAGSLIPKKLLTEQNITPKWKKLSTKRVYGIYGQGFTEQSFSSLAGQLYGHLAALAAPMSYSQLQPIGVSIDNPWVGEQAESRFFAGFVEGLSEHQDNLESFDWQAGDWACFTHLGPHNTMWQTISQIYAQWVLPNGIKLKNQHIVQLYLNNPITTAPELIQTELYFAVDERNLF